MKKKGILLLGSLALMVVAMVFIAVTLISRSSVTPSTSDAATPKKKNILIDNKTVPTSTKYTFQKLETNLYEISDAVSINDLGNVLGFKYYNYTTIPELTLWDKDGKSSKIEDKNLINYHFYPTKINNQNTIIGDITYENITSFRAAKYTSNKVYTELKGFPYDPSSYIDSKNELINKSSFKSKQIYNNYLSSIIDNKEVLGKFDETYAFDINNEGDIVGFSNKKAVLWINDKPEPIDLSFLLNTKVKEGGIGSAAAYAVSDRQSGIIKIAIITTDSLILNMNDYYDHHYIINYSIAENKIISNKYIDYLEGQRVWGLSPKRFLNDGSLVSTVAFYNEKLIDGSIVKLDGYITSPIGNYTVSQNIRPLLEKYGYKSPLMYLRRMNNKLQGIGTYVSINEGYKERYFLINLKNNEVSLLENMTTNGQIIGYTDSAKLYATEINEKGEILVHSEYSETNDSNILHFSGKLIPVK